MKYRHLSILLFVVMGVTVASAARLFDPPAAGHDWTGPWLAGNAGVAFLGGAQVSIKFSSTGFTLGGRSG